MATARDQLSQRASKMRPYEQAEWTNAEQEAWLLLQAYEGTLRAVETSPKPQRQVLLGKTAAARLVEDCLRRLTRIMGGGTFARHSPFGFWFEDVRALGFLPWSLAYDALFASSFTSGRIVFRSVKLEVRRASVIVESLSLPVAQRKPKNVAILLPSRHSNAADGVIPNRLAAPRQLMPSRCVDHASPEIEGEKLADPGWPLHQPQLRITILNPWESPMRFSLRLWSALMRIEPDARTRPVADTAAAINSGDDRVTPRLPACDPWRPSRSTYSWSPGGHILLLRCPSQILNQDKLRRRVGASKHF